ncbi:ABC transporter C family member 10 [Bienertia sinuspersici]
MIIVLSAEALLLNSFIQVAEGKEAFRYEGYVHSKLIVIRMRSMLTTAIYKKQQKLSNIAKEVHSNGKITNYVTVYAHRIGEFPFWFHQTWTTIL